MGNAESQETSGGRATGSGRTPKKTFHPSLERLCKKLVAASEFRTSPAGERRFGLFLNATLHELMYAN